MDLSENTGKHLHGMAVHTWWHGVIMHAAANTRGEHGGIRHGVCLAKK